MAAASRRMLMFFELVLRKRVQDEKTTILHATVSPSNGAGGAGSLLALARGPANNQLGRLISLDYVLPVRVEPGGCDFASGRSCPDAH